MKPRQLMIVLLMTVASATIAVGVVMAAPATSDRVASLTDDLTSAVSPVPAPTITPTLPTTCVHPVAQALADYFSIPYTQVIALHDSGIGFGVIARAYMTAWFSDDQLTPTLALQLHQSGIGWGQIMKEYGVHPGGKGLGAIMRGHANGTPPDQPSGTGDGISPAGQSGGGNQPACPGKSCSAPGHAGRSKK